MRLFFKIQFVVSVECKCFYSPKYFIFTSFALVMPFIQPLLTQLFQLQTLVRFLFSESMIHSHVVKLLLVALCGGMQVVFRYTAFD